MSKEYKRRETIFNKYARNLAWIQENPSFCFEPRVEDGYVCPFCFTVFGRDDLKDDSERFKITDYCGGCNL